MKQIWGKNLFCVARELISSRGVFITGDLSGTKVYRDRYFPRLKRAERTNTSSPLATTIAGAISLLPAQLCDKQSHEQV